MSIQLLVGITLVIIISLKVQAIVITHKNVCPLNVVRRSASALFWTKLAFFKFRVHLSNIDRWMSLVIIVIYVLWTLTFLFLQHRNEVFFMDRMTVHSNRFLVNKTNRCTEFQFYWYYYSTCFGQPFCQSSGVLSRTSALVHFMQLCWTICYQE